MTNKPYDDSLVLVYSVVAPAILMMESLSHEQARSGRDETSNGTGKDN